METKYGRLTIIRKTEKRIANRPIWECLCDCGKLVEVAQDSLRLNGGTKSCGCLLREKITERGRGLVDITGNTYSDLTVLGNSGLRKFNRILWECKCKCGNIRFHYKSTLTGGKVKSCGCHKANIARANSGPKHYNWKGGLNVLTTKNRRCQELINWRKAVFLRDDYTCCLCSKKGKRLNAHHLNSYATFPVERYDIANGVTLCIKCHNAFHKEYGKQNNVKEQFEAYRNKTPP